MLFSGGLDSLVGAIDWLEAGQRLLLVSHYDFGQLAAIQQALAAALLRHYGPERVHHLGVRVQFPQAPELHPAEPLAALSGPGAGRGRRPSAAGPPSSSRKTAGSASTRPSPATGWAAYSTRTTHPYFLERAHGLWRAAGLEQPLVNPYQDRTKGEMLLRCRNRDLLGNCSPRRVSCARPVVSRWQGRPAGPAATAIPA